MLPKLNRDLGVRALFGLFIVAGAVFTMSWLAIGGNSQALQILGDALFAVIGFYYGQRSVQSGTTNQTV